MLLNVRNLAVFADDSVNSFIIFIIFYRLIVLNTNLFTVVGVDKAIKSFQCVIEILFAQTKYTVNFIGKDMEAVFLRNFYDGVEFLF